MNNGGEWHAIGTKQSGFLTEKGTNGASLPFPLSISVSLRLLSASPSQQEKSCTMFPACFMNSHITIADDRKSVNTHQGKNGGMSSASAERVMDRDRHRSHSGRNDGVSQSIHPERRESSDSFVSKERQSRLEDVISDICV